jgi:CRP/FNR family transcriptional regulator
MYSAKSQQSSPLSKLRQHPPPQQCLFCNTYKACDTGHLLQNQAPDVRQQVLQEIQLKRGQHLFHQGDILTSVYVIKSGLFKSYMTSEAGDEQVVDFPMPGQVLGADVFADSAQTLSAVALDKALVCCIDFNNLETRTSPSLAHWLARQVLTELLRERQILSLTRIRFHAANRVAGFLLDLSTRYRALGFPDREFKLIIPQRDIALYLDLALETVSRVFSRLQDQGVVHIERPYIRILDIEALRTLAEPEHRPG